MAQGFPYTHAGKSQIDFNLLSKWCLSAGMADHVTEKISGANFLFDFKGNLIAEKKSIGGG